MEIPSSFFPTFLLYDIHLFWDSHNQIALLILKKDLCSYVCVPMYFSLLPPWVQTTTLFLFCFKFFPNNSAFLLLPLNILLFSWSTNYYAITPASPWFSSSFPSWNILNTLPICFPELAVLDALQVCFSRNLPPCSQ